MIALLVITDGRRDCITRTIASAQEHLVGPITRRVIYDDSGDLTNRAWLRVTFPDFEIAYHPEGRQGFGGAIRAAWAVLLDGTERFVFHLEDDFTFGRYVNLEAMAHVLDHRPHLAQLALRRQPWNDTERAAGGVVETNPESYLDAEDADGYPAGESLAWLEHRLFFTTNPSLYRTDLCQRGWPLGAQSEGFFSAGLFLDPTVRCAYWGRRNDEPWVIHIGKERNGIGY
jgi:hypothetical protein